VTGLLQVVKGGHKEGLGFKYVDILDPKTPIGENYISENSIKPIAPMTYEAVNNQTDYKVLKGESMSFAFDFRDWKYMSKF